MAMVSLTAEKKHVRREEAILVSNWGPVGGAELTLLSTVHVPGSVLDIACLVSLFSACEVSFCSAYSLGS